MMTDSLTRMWWGNGYSRLLTLLQTARLGCLLLLVVGLASCNRGTADVAMEGPPQPATSDSTVDTGASGQLQTATTNDSGYDPDAAISSEHGVPVSLQPAVTEHGPECPDSHELLDSLASDSLGADSTSRPKYWLGIQSLPAPKPLLDQFDLSCGLLVHRVIEGGPSTGLLFESDLITHFNGQEINCQRKLCGMVTAVGTEPVTLTVIRKAKSVSVQVMPQAFTFLADGQILQYTVLANEIDSPPAFGNTGIKPTGVENLRLFVVQPMLHLCDQPETELTIEHSPSQWQMVRVASFRFDANGKRILVVQEGGQVREYDEERLSDACDEIKRLFEWIDQGP